MFIFLTKSSEVLKILWSLLFILAFRIERADGRGQGYSSRLYQLRKVDRKLRTQRRDLRLLYLISCQPCFSRYSAESTLTKIGIEKRSKWPPGYRRPTPFSEGCRDCKKVLSIFYLCFPSRTWDPARLDIWGKLSAELRGAILVRCSFCARQNDSHQL